MIYEPPEEGTLNLGPALSPDGDEVVYVSQSDIFSIEMFLADAHTGEIKRRLTNNAVDPHFESLQFIHSAGDWHPDGRLFAIAGIKTGEPLLTIMDVASADIVREIRIEGFEVGAIYTPSWSPDGTRIAFSGQSHGFTDLYVLDVETEVVTRLTADPFADLQPAWSPDGRSLAFTTDRYTTDLELLVAGPYQVAVFDFESGAIQGLPGFDDQFRNYNPQWSPDGRNLYFVSDHDGIANLYRIDLETRERYLITDLWTGVSGLTAISPAVSVARGTGDVAFSVNKGGPFSYEVYVIDDPDVLVGEPAPDMLVGVDASIIPPRERISTAHVELLDNARLGLADPITFEDDEYRSQLSLDFISQPTIAFGASDLGVFFAGGAALFFSDLLGNQTLQTILQVNTTFGNLVQGTALLAGYENLSSRWNRALIAGQVPLVTRQLSFEHIPFENRSVNIFRDFRWFEVNREVTGILAYPFNRNSRIEFSASARQIDFSGETEELWFDAFTGEFLNDVQEDLIDCPPGEFRTESGRACAPESLYMGTGSVALVYDSSIFGGTSPIVGQRYRFEVEPSVGTLNFFTINGDVRRYVRAGPFTVAGRALHFGRWGGGSDDWRLGRAVSRRPFSDPGLQRSVHRHPRVHGGRRSGVLPLPRPRAAHREPRRGGEPGTSTPAPRRDRRGPGPRRTAGRGRRVLRHRQGVVQRDVAELPGRRVLVQRAPMGVQRRAADTDQPVRSHDRGDRLRQAVRPARQGLALAVQPHARILTRARALVPPDRR